LTALSSPVSYFAKIAPKKEKSGFRRFPLMSLLQTATTPTTEIISEKKECDDRKVLFLESAVAEDNNN
jgi:hypothetical protein